MNIDKTKLEEIISNQVKKEIKSISRQNLTESDYSKAYEFLEKLYRLSLTSFESEINQLLGLNEAYKKLLKKSLSGELSTEMKEQAWLLLKDSVKGIDDYCDNLYDKAFDKTIRMMSTKNVREGDI